MKRIKTKVTTFRDNTLVPALRDLRSRSRRTYEQKNARDTAKIIGWLKKALKASERVARRSNSIKSYALEDMLQQLSVEYERLPELLKGMKPLEKQRRSPATVNPFVIDWEERIMERELLKSKREVKEEKQEIATKRPSVFDQGELESLFSDFELLDKERLK